MMPSSPKRHAASHRPAKDPPETIDSSSSSDSSSPNSKRRKVTHDEKFQAMFERLYAYKREHGDCLVPYRWGPDPPLGKWVNSQRLLNDQQKLSIERVRQLDSIGFVWRVKQRLLWDDMYNRLLEFKKEHGHVMVPQRYKDAKGFSLGRWVDTQRENKDRRLTPEHKKRLDDIGFVWSALKESWDEMYGRLVDFQKKNGHTNVTQRYAADPKLGKWVKNQRLRRDCLSDERVARLEKIGFVWCVQKKQQRDNWDKMYNALKKYKEQHGNCLVPLGYEGNKPLAIWVNTHRQSKGMLTSHQVKRLNAIDFEWAVPQQKDVAQVVWDCMFEKLAEYKQRHGTCDVPNTTSREDYATLALWVQTQRAAKLFGGITQQQVERLNNLGFSWQSSQDYLWNNRPVQQQSTASRQAPTIPPSVLQLRRSQSPAWVSGWDSNPSTSTFSATSVGPGGHLTPGSSKAAATNLLPGRSQFNNACSWDLQSSGAPSVTNTAAALPLSRMTQQRINDRVISGRSNPQDLLLRNLLERQHGNSIQQQQQQRPTANMFNRAQGFSAATGHLKATLTSQAPLQNMGASSQAALQHLATLDPSTRASSTRTDLSSLPTAALLALRSHRAADKGQSRGTSSGALKPPYKTGEKQG